MASTFHDFTLPNGLRVICETMPRVSSVAIGFLVSTGARHEHSHLHGVSHFLEHMCFKGTESRTWYDINVRFDELGSIYNAFTGKTYTMYYGWVPADRLEPQLELLADMMRPALREDDFNTERNVILEEIAMGEDSFDRHVWNFLHKEVFAGHSLSHEILGEKETIEKLPHTHLVEYHRQRYSPGNMVLFVSGAITPEDVFAAAGRHCGHWPRTPDGSPPDGQIPNLDTGVRKLPLPRFQQQSLVLIYPSVPQNDPQAENIEAFTSLFGGRNSRCYWNIVQKGMCSQAGAIWLAYEDCGYLILYADGEPPRCEEMLAALRAQVREVLDGGFDADEIKRVKNHRKTHLALEAENPRTRLMQLVDDFETYGRVRTLDARIADVESVTRKGISRYLEKYPIDGEGLLLSCGPRDWP